MARPHASLALAALVVTARLLGAGGAAASSTTPIEESIRAEVGHHHAPSRSVRSPHGAHGRAAARCSSLGAWLAALPPLVEDPPRTLVPPSAPRLAPPITAAVPPRSRARAPPSASVRASTTCSV